MVDLGMVVGCLMHGSMVEQGVVFASSGENLINEDDSCCGDVHGGGVEAVD